MFSIWGEGSTFLTRYYFTEIVQQSKARHKDDFPLAFAPIIPEAAAVAYKGATPDVQNKIRRVVEVWRDRSVFEGPIQTAIESRIDGSFTFPPSFLTQRLTIS